MNGSAEVWRKIYAGLLIVAVFCVFSFPLAASASIMKVIVLTSGNSWTVPGDWNNYDNKVEVTAVAEEEDEAAPIALAAEAEVRTRWSEMSI